MGHDLGGLAQDRRLAPAGQQEHLVGVLDDPLQPVFGQQHRGAEVVHQPLQHGEHLLGRARVERGRGFVQHQHLGVDGQHRADRHPLLLAAGERAQGAPAQLGQAQQVEGLLDPAPHHGGGQAQRLHAVGEFVLHGVGDEVRDRVLADGADQVGEFARAVVAGVAAVDGDPAGQLTAGEVRDEAADGAQQGGLAGAGRTDQQAQFALGDGQVDPVQGESGGVGVPDRDPVEGDHWVLRGGSGATAAGSRPSRIAAAGSRGRVGAASGTTDGVKASG